MSKLQLFECNFKAQLTHSWVAILIKCLEVLYHHIKTLIFLIYELHKLDLLIAKVI